MKHTFENPQTRARSTSFALVLALSVFSILPLSQAMSAKVEKNEQKENFTKVNLNFSSEKNTDANAMPVLPNFQNESMRQALKMETVLESPPLAKAFNSQGLEVFDFGEEINSGENIGKKGNFGFESSISQGIQFEVFEFSQLDKIPRRLNSVSVKYPPSLLERGVEGKVEMLVVIDEKGTVTLEKVLSSTHAEFEESAKDAVKKLRYETPIRDGISVRARFILPMPFKIKNF